MLTMMALPALVGIAYGQAPDAAPAPVLGDATLPRDLSPWGMFTSADIVVKAVIVGLALASIVTWTVWLAKTIEIFLARRRVSIALRSLAPAASLSDVRSSDLAYPAAEFRDAAIAEFRLSADALAHIDGIKERIASRFERIEAACSRRISRGTGVLATIGATAPFVGLFGTVWGIMNSFIGISKSHTIWRSSLPGSPRRCSPRRLGLRRRFPPSSSTTCSHARSVAIARCSGTRRPKYCGWSVAISIAAPRPAPTFRPRRSRP
jgi:biopolymer transport protein ExbB